MLELSKETTKTRDEIIEYLGLEEDFEQLEEIINIALHIENKYNKQLANGNYGYGLSGDLDVVGRLEDSCYELDVVEEIDDIVVYNKLLEIENEHLGIMYLDLSEEERIKLLDSNKEYVGYTYYYEEKDIQKTINALIEIKHISDIVNLGFCNNMIFGESFDDIIEIYIEYNENCDISEEEKDFNIKELKESVSEYVNQIGNNYFLVDYTEL